MATIVNRPALRVKAYAAGERLQIIELCILHLINQCVSRNDMRDELVNRLAANRCNQLMNYAGKSYFELQSVSTQLSDSGFVKFTDPTRTHLKVTTKGRTYMRQCSTRVKQAAAKLVCDVLDRLAVA